ncbi:hypothetical protein M0805_005364 [Coniferiporia weirii]|nr:hypothetical protein M0805_005364 [Coniferiporia weirii]
MMLAAFSRLSRNSVRSATRRLVSTNIHFPPATDSQPSVVEPQLEGNANQTPLSELTQPERSYGTSSAPIIVASTPGPPASEAQAHPFAGAKEYAEIQEAKNAVTTSNLPTLPHGKESGQSHLPAYATPPFDTHHFFSELERTFPSSTANSLMRATRALLVDRIGEVRRNALTLKDLENQAYLFRAALSEARNEISLRQRNDSATLRTSLAALRRELDSLDVKMKSDIANLKHELQMDLDNRKTESKTDLKQMDITIEEVLNKAIVSIGDMRATTEELKWENMRRAVLALGAFAVSIVIVYEFSHTSNSKTKQSSPAPSPFAEPRQDSVLDGLEQVV